MSECICSPERVDQGRPHPNCRFPHNEPPALPPMERENAALRARIAELEEEREQEFVFLEKAYLRITELMRDLAAALQRAEAAEARAEGFRQEARDANDRTYRLAELVDPPSEEKGAVRLSWYREAEIEAAALRAKAEAAEAMARWLRSPIDQVGSWTCECCGAYNEHVAPEPERHKTDCPVGRYRAAGGQG